MHLLGGRSLRNSITFIWIKRLPSCNEESPSRWRNRRQSSAESQSANKQTSQMICLKSPRIDYCLSQGFILSSSSCFKLCVRVRTPLNVGGSEKCGCNRSITIASDIQGSAEPPRTDLAFVSCHDLFSYDHSELASPLNDRPNAGIWSRSWSNAWLTRSFVPTLGPFYRLKANVFIHALKKCCIFIFCTWIIKMWGCFAWILRDRARQSGA